MQHDSPSVYKHDSLAKVVFDCAARSTAAAGGLVWCGGPELLSDLNFFSGLAENLDISTSTVISGFYIISEWRFIMIGIVDVYSHKNRVPQQSYQNNATLQRDLC